MISSITLDSAGRLVLPKAVRERLHLHAGAKMKLEVVADKIELTPEPDENVRVVKKGGLLLLTGLGENFDAVKAIKAAREEREEQLSRRARGR